MNHSQFCPLCGAQMREERLGLRLTPLKARLLDAVKQAGATGIPATELFLLLYHDRPEASYATLRAHVNQINDLLVTTDWRIRSHMRCYRLVEERT